MLRFSPLKPIKPILEDPAQRRASFPVIALLIPGIIIALSVLLFPVFVWIRGIMLR